MTHGIVADLWRHVGLRSWGDVVGVVLSTLVMYTFFVGLVRLLGQRVLSRVSGFDVAAVIALGAITGRVTLGYTPTLLAGCIALVTLFAAEAAVGELRRLTRFGDVFDNRAVLLVCGGEIQQDLVRSVHFVEDELRSSIRSRGVRRLEDVAVAILERTGEITVLAAGAPIDPWLLDEVVGGDRVPPRLLTGIRSEDGTPDD